MEPDPYLSAVVYLRRDSQTDPDEATVENPGGVGGEAAAILEGSSPTDESTSSRVVSPADVAVPVHGGAIARTKAYFTKAGFEVHAPVGDSFSIGAPQSHFEDFFGQRLTVDQERLFGSVTTVDGEDHLPLEALPEEVRAMVESISFPPPPELPSGLA